MAAEKIDVKKAGALSTIGLPLQGTDIVVISRGGDTMLRVALAEIAAYVGGGGGSYQPANANLDLLAALAVNKLVARASTGPAAAFNVSDNALSFIAAADFGAMRTALSVGRYFGTVTFAGLSALTGMAVGDRVYVSDLTSEWVYSGSRWFPPAGVLLYNRQGSIAAPIATLTGVTSGQFALPGGNPAVPANLMAAGSRIYASQVLRRRGANATAGTNMRLGTLGTSSDNFFWGANAVAATDGLSVLVRTEVGVASTTRYFQLAVAQANAQAGSAAAADRTGNFDTTAINYISSDISGANAADSFDLISMSVRIDP